jgi:hypothetical protein
MLKSFLRSVATISIFLSLALNVAEAASGKGGAGGLGATGGHGGSGSGADGGTGLANGIPGCGGGTDPAPDGKFYIPGTSQECNPGEVDRKKLETKDIWESCLKTTTSKLPTAELLERLDTFRDDLPAPDRQRLDQMLPRSSDGGIARCAKVDTSRASCENGEYIGALRSTGLLTVFLSNMCPKR